MQADSPYRTGPESLAHFYTPSDTTAASSTNAGGALAPMIPLTSVVNAQWNVASPTLTRYNGFAAVEIVGSQAPGHSSGEAMNAMQQIVEKDLPPGFGYDWAGQSHQELLSAGQTTMLMVLSIVVVFLCLAALYESWSVPVSVLLVVPVGILGAVVLTMLRHYYGVFAETADASMSNDIYFKIGLITVIGLAAKNAILIVEFAIQERQAGKPLGAAVVEAAKLRLRPILMTSLAFIMGVLPLAISTGAGANARHAIGTGVIGGMLAATFLGLLFIPVFYAIVRRLLGDKLDVAPDLSHHPH
jgi:multidrug efflux pump